MDKSNKIICFEYILYQLINWYKELRPTDTSLISFTRLKVLKLLFFVSAIREQDEDLLDIFNKFYAMQHGPVESDIYNAMIDDELTYYNFRFRSVNGFERVCEDDFKEIDDRLRNKINTSINRLKKQNKFIVTYTAFEEVNLSHRWNSWKITMHIAEVVGKGSGYMNIDLIRKDSQYFSL